MYLSMTRVGGGGGGRGGGEWEVQKVPAPCPDLFENKPLKLELQKIASFPKIYYGTVSFNKVVFSINFFLWNQFLNDMLTDPFLKCS